MTFLVEITPIAEAQTLKAYNWYRERNPEFADNWFRGLMNTIATLQEKPLRCGLAIEHDIFPEEVRQLLYGKSKNIYRVLFTLMRQDTEKIDTGCTSRLIASLLNQGAVSVEYKQAFLLAVVQIAKLRLLNLNLHHHN